MVTTQGEIVVPKFLALKGPNGTYSHFCISRAGEIREFRNVLHGKSFSFIL